MDVQEHNQPGVSRSLSVALYLIGGYVRVPSRSVTTLNYGGRF
jgi:hypothetical protein